MLQGEDSLKWRAQINGTSLSLCTVLPRGRGILLRVRKIEKRKTTIARYGSPTQSSLHHASILKALRAKKTQKKTMLFIHLAIAPCQKRKLWNAVRFEFIFAHYILIFFGILILIGNHTHGFIRHQCIFTHLQQQHSKPKQVFFTTCDKI